MTEKDLYNIFKANKKDFSDESFIRKLKHQLPDRHSVAPQIIIAIFSAVGFVLVYWITGIEAIHSKLNSFVQFVENVKPFNLYYIFPYIFLLTTAFVTGYAMFKAGEE
ncbi:MAG: DUF5056 domain-containing protein [Bacteroidales bacterium]|jgi:hypothetical protein|nr:DUF5056 domain-containing protein [Bacteroidales bacterium]